ncbi:hypothetical protein TNCT_280031 [Trichonephila clavata]|uniref:Uncharacterized protein n=1 Tax=Trichonephila clavata TaxID=2740835 RepID=A0A8X6K8L7_TRICU|nr:hypothetical protein TNCT_280031 [Trichonephila clavata]
MRTLEHLRILSEAVRPSMSQLKATTNLGQLASLWFAVIATDWDSFGVKGSLGESEKARGHDFNTINNRRGYDVF